MCKTGNSGPRCWVAMLTLALAACVSLGLAQQGSFPNPLGQDPNLTWTASTQTLKIGSGSTQGKLALQTTGPGTVTLSAQGPTNSFILPASGGGAIASNTGASTTNHCVSFLDTTGYNLTDTGLGCNATGFVGPVLGGTFANLPASANGAIYGCSDCLAGSNPCTGSSTGALAVRQNGAWVCK